MGGFGSGIWIGLRSRKETTKDLLALDVRQLKREGRIVPGQKKLIVTQGVELEIAWQPLNFGGARPWFVCLRCGRRAAILYLKGRDLLCRRCHNLAYPSQYEPHETRALSQARRRALKLKARLGAAPDEELVTKPKGMHHRTFVRLGREYVKAVLEWRTLYGEWGALLAEQNSRMLEEMERERIEFDL